MNPIKEDSAEEKQIKKTMAWSNLLLLFTFPLEGVIFFGTIMGWPNMVEVLKQLHVYEDLCDLSSNQTEIVNGIVNCNQRDVIFSTAGTIGGFSMNVMTLVFGLIVDKKGLFLSRSLITITVSIGLICLMFTPDANWLMFPGVFLHSAGGYAFVLTNATMATLFPKFAAIVLVLGQCFFQIGSSYFRVLSIIFESGVPYKWIIGANLLLTIPVWMRTLFLFPVKRFELGMNVLDASFLGKRFKKSAKIENVEIQNSEEAQKEEINKDSAWIFFKDVNFVVMIIWIVFANLNVLFCTFTWNAYTREVAGNDYQKHVGSFGNFAWTASIFAITVGLCSDGLTKVYSSKPAAFGKILGVFIFVILNLIIGVIFGALQLAFDESLILPIIFIYNIYRAWAYSLVAVFIKFIFPVKFFGSLLGAQRCALGITSLAMLGLPEIPKSFGEDGFRGIFYFFIACQIAMIVFPVILGRKLKIMKKET